MSHAMPSTVPLSIRRMLNDPRTADPDPELLRRFVAERDGAAFEVLLRRHGPMVLDVCRGLLGNQSDAEDAFQATFLVLARKAGSIRKAGSLASWLHGVACRAARRAKTESARRRKYESRVPGRGPGDTDDTPWREVRQVLHEELDRLPDRLRGPLVLCYLEGKTHDEAATALHLPKGMLRGRLERARALLRERLLRRGLGSAAVLISAWPGVATAGVPAPLVRSTVEAATPIVTGVCSSVPTNVVILTHGVLQAMLATQLKRVLTIALVVSLLGTATALLGGLPQTSAAPRGAALALEVGSPGPDPPAPVNPKRVIYVGAGKVVEVARDGKSVTLATPPRGGEQQKKLVFKLTDKTAVEFSGIGPGGAKVTPGYHAHVWAPSGSKDVAARLHLMGEGSARATPTYVGRLESVSEGGKAITVRPQPNPRSPDQPETVEIRLTAKTAQLYSYVAKGGTKPVARPGEREGHTVSVWLEWGSEDTAAMVHFWGRVEKPETADAATADAVGRVVALSKDGKSLSLEIPAAAPGEVVRKLEVKVNDETRVAYVGVGPEGDRPTKGYLARVWLSGDAKDTAARLVLQAVPDERLVALRMSFDPLDPDKGPTTNPRKEAQPWQSRILRGRVADVAKDGASVTLELPPDEEGGEPRKATVKFTADTRQVFNGVGPGEAHLTVGYQATVWLRHGSNDTAEHVMLTARPPAPPNR